MNYQTDEAKKLLEESVLSEGERNFAEGLYFLYNGDYKNALRNLEKAPTTGGGFDWKEYAKTMLLITNDFISQKIDGFIVRCAPRDRIMMHYLKKVLPEINKSMKKYFGEGAKDVALEIYPDRESFIKASLLTEEELERSGTVAISKFNRLMILSPRLLPYGYDWQDSVSHEYIHRIIGRKTAMNIPLYLNEGIARTFETLWREEKPVLSPSVKSALGRARKEGFIEFEKFTRGMPSLSDQSQVNLAFAEVNYLVYSMYEKRGVSEISRLLDDCGKTGFEEAFAGHFGAKEVFLNDYWEFLKNNLWEDKGAAPDYIYWKKDDEFLTFSIRDFMRLGDRFRMAGENELALAQYEKARQKEPENYIVLVKIAKTRAATGDFEKAEEYFEKALSASPSNFTCLASFADFLFARAEYEKCASLIQKALERNPFYGKGYEMLITIYKRCGLEKESEKNAELLKLL